MLFDLNERTDAAKNHPDWQDLFVRATANYLMAISSYQAPSRTEALARKEWLEDTEVDPAGMLGDMITGIGKVFSEGFFDDIFTSAHVQMENSWRNKNEQTAAASNQAEAIDAGEANWLIERINRDGVVNSNEKALLAFLRKESHNVDPKVLQLMDKVA